MKVTAKVTGLWHFISWSREMQVWEDTYRVSLMLLEEGGCVLTEEFDIDVSALTYARYYVGEEVTFTDERVRRG